MRSPTGPYPTTHQVDVGEEGDPPVTGSISAPPTIIEQIQKFPHAGDQSLGHCRTICARSVVRFGSHEGTHGGLVPSLGYYIWAVHGVEDWNTRPAVTQTKIGQALRQVEAQALARVGLDPARVSQRPAGDGAVLVLPGDFPKGLVTTKYVDALCEGIEEYDAESGPGETIRLRLALHAGESPAGDEWASPGAATATRLANAAVLRRVLAAAKGSALALAVSRTWYRAVIHGGYAPAEGYQEVRIEAPQSADWAWVRVPGRTQPPGLLPEDRRPSSRPDSAGDGEASSPATGAETSVSNYGTVGALGDFRGATIHGDVGFGNNYYGATRADQDRRPREEGGLR